MKNFIIIGLVIVIILMFLGWYNSPGQVRNRKIVDQINACMNAGGSATYCAQSAPPMTANQ